MSERIIPALQKSDTSAYDNWRGIVKNRVYREEWGTSESGESIYIGCFYQQTSSDDVVFLCGVAVGMEIWAMVRVAQAKTVRNVAMVARCWESQVGTQLRRISKGKDAVPFRAEDKERLIGALRHFWPTNVAQDEERPEGLLFSPMGKVIGQFRGGIWSKAVSGREHFLQKPPAIAFEADVVDSLSGRINGFSVYDKDTGTTYALTGEEFDSFRGELDRGYGRQYFVTMGHWSRSGGAAAVVEAKRVKKHTEPAKVLPAAPDAAMTVKQVSLDFD